MWKTLPKIRHTVAVYIARAPQRINTKLGTEIFYKNPVIKKKNNLYFMLRTDTIRGNMHVTTGAKHNSNT